MKSMTGMGSAKAKFGDNHLSLEIKSVNHRYCEVHTRLLPRYQSLEIPIVQAVKKRLARGKVDVWLGEERSEPLKQVNLDAVKKYHAFLKKLKKELKLPGEITLSDIQEGSSFWLLRENNGKEIGPEVAALVAKALDQLEEMRKKEGGILLEQLKKRKATLEALVGRVAARREEIRFVLEEKLKKRVQRHLEGVEMDPAKLANEIVFYADRSDISEEIDRLTSHFEQMQKLFGSREPCGRSLDFLIQEMFREINTIGSKCQDTSISHEVVEAKSELEKIREQIQNIE